MKRKAPPKRVNIQKSVQQVVAPSSSSFMESLSEYQLKESQREVQQLQQLAYMPSADGQLVKTWMQRSQELSSQLELSQPNSQKKLEITWLTDSHDCETCGSSWAEGAVVKLNGNVILDMSPVATCYDGVNFSTDQVFAAILEHVGFSIEQK